MKPPVETGPERDERYGREMMPEGQAEGEPETDLPPRAIPAPGKRPVDGSDSHCPVRREDPLLQRIGAGDP